MLQLSWAALLDTCLKLAGIFLYTHGWVVSCTHFAHCTYWRSYLGESFGGKMEHFGDSAIGLLIALIGGATWESHLGGRWSTLETRLLESLIWYQSTWHPCLGDGFTCIRASWMFAGMRGSILIA